MRVTSIVLAVLLSGCATAVPVKREFPPMADSLGTTCPNLELIAPPVNDADERKLSEIAIVITNNYAEYHKCQARVDAWLSWYEQQKKIFNESQK